MLSRASSKLRYSAVQTSSSFKLAGGPDARFRDKTSKILAKHNLNVIGFWVPNDSPAWDNTFIFMVAHSSREEAKKNWDAMRNDPEFQEVIKSEQADKTVEKVDVTFMRPTDFSPLK